MPVGGKIASQTVDAENVESQPLFTGERFSTEKDSQKVQGPGSDGWHNASMAPVSTLSRACALRYVPGRRTMKNKQTNKFEIASTEQ